MPRKVIATAALIAVVFAASLLLLGGKGEAYTYAGGEIKPAKAAPPIVMTDQDGQPFTLDQLKGKVALIYFGYTTCPDLCPTTLSDFTAVKEGLGSQADRVAFMMVTVDPERDTVPVLHKYLGFFDPDFIGLRGDDQQTDLVKKEYGVVSKKVEYPNSATKYLVDHTSLIYVVDTEGRLRLTYPYGTDPALIAKDVLHLLG